MQYDPTATQNHPSAHAGFTKIYEGNPPWDIGKPQPPFVAIADRVLSPVLDAGCGTGNTALFFAARGHRVTGIDFVEEAIRRARAKAAERDLPVEFLVKDAMTLGGWDERFASVIDSGLFHIYAGDEQRRYVQGLAHVVQPGGQLFLFTFTEEAPEGGVSRQQLYDIFADGWDVESVELVRGEVSPAFTAEFPEAFPEGGPKGWFAVIRRKVESNNRGVERVASL
ncbi:MAG: class I SAM-dependent methyltransferase [Terriglobia bacterium]